MSSSVDNATRARRPHDARASRAALLEAAAEVFAERGYERATTREIGERAEVDPALICRYFDGKEGLYLEALAASDAHAGADHEPAALLESLLERWDERGHSPVSRALAGTDLSPDVLRQVREIVRRNFLEGAAEALGRRGASNPELRAELLLALAVGVAVTRANGTLESLQGAAREELVAELGPALEALAST